jgi:hypothetical protein
MGTAQISTSQFKYGTASMYFPGTAGNYISIPDSTALKFGTQNFSVECWINTSTYTGQASRICAFNAVSSSYASFVLGIHSDGRLAVAISSNGSSWDIANSYGSTSKPVLSLNTWTHVSFSRVNNMYYIYQNGTLIESGACSGSLYGGGTMNRIGCSTYSTPEMFTGYIDDFRLTIGKTRMGFAVPTEQLT